MFVRWCPYIFGARFIVFRFSSCVPARLTIHGFRHACNTTVLHSPFAYYCSNSGAPQFVVRFCLSCVCLLSDSTEICLCFPRHINHSFPRSCRGSKFEGGVPQRLWTVALCTAPYQCSFALFEVPVYLSPSIPHSAPSNLTYL